MEQAGYVDSLVFGPFYTFFFSWKCPAAGAETKKHLLSKLFFFYLDAESNLLCPITDLVEQETSPDSNTQIVTRLPRIKRTHFPGMLIYCECL